MVEHAETEPFLPSGRDSVTLLNLENLHADALALLRPGLWITPRHYKSWPEEGFVRNGP